MTDKANLADSYLMESDSFVDGVSLNRRIFKSRVYEHEDESKHGSHDEKEEYSADYDEESNGSDNISRQINSVL